MNKKIAFIWMLCMSPIFYAQTTHPAQKTESVADNSPTLEEKVRKYQFLQKVMLEEQIHLINLRLENKEITQEEAKNLKANAAIDSASKIQDYVQEQMKTEGLHKKNREEIAVLPHGEELETEDAETTDTEGDSIPHSEKKELRIKDILHFSPNWHIVVGAGFNNALVNSSLDASPYQVWGSRYFEVGLEKSVQLSKDSLVTFSYGFMFQFNGLQPEGNRYHQHTDSGVQLAESPQNLTKSKLRIDQLELPVHLSYGFKNKTSVSLGGFLGTHLNTVQKLQYQEGNTSRQLTATDHVRGSRFVYGLSGMLRRDNWAISLRYEMNPLFRDSGNSMRNISLGLRWWL